MANIANEIGKTALCGVLAAAVLAVSWAACEARGDRTSGQYGQSQLGTSVVAGAGKQRR